jgi:hypothetical protein
MRTSAVAMGLVCWVASGAQAIDGVREINQACAVGPGCFAGDGAGFPVDVTTPGSYRLTGNLILPNQNTDGISIQAAGVHVDLNGFSIRGTNTYAGPTAACTAAGSGSGISAGPDDVTVSNGHVVGMGTTGIVLFGGNARVDRVTAEQNCGDGIRVGSHALVTNSMMRRNFLNGISAAGGSLVRRCVADVNGATGITSTTSSTDLTIESCVSNANGVDGVFVGPRSRVNGCLTLANGDDGIAALQNGLILENVANGNGDRGITVLGSAAATDSTGVGLNVASGNGGSNLVGGCQVGCNVIGGIRQCPPSPC